MVLRNVSGAGAGWSACAAWPPATPGNHPRSMRAESPEEDMVGTRVRDRLTPKEMRIVALIVQGCKNREIAHAP